MSRIDEPGWLQIGLMCAAGRRSLWFRVSLRSAAPATDLPESQRAALIGMEGAHSLEGSLERFEQFARRGVRYLGLLHFSKNEAGYPRLAVEALLRRGILEEKDLVE